MARSLDGRIRDARALVRQRIREVRDRVDSLEAKLEQGRILNLLGELQQLGPQLDAAVAVLATLEDMKQSGGN